MNDETYKEYGLLMITEPRLVRFDQGEWLITPQQHSTWIPVQPKYEQQEHRFRAMIWVHKDVQFQELKTGSRDVAAVMIKAGDETILAISVYVEAKTSEEDVELGRAVAKIEGVIQEARRASTETVEILVTGDFNRHDQLWGGDAIGSTQRQGEGTPIIDMMAEHDLQGLLPRGTITWQARGQQSTIDLTLASAGLTERLLKCNTDDTAHGSDHLAIDIEFDLTLSESREVRRKLWKRARWDRLREMVADELKAKPAPDNDRDLNGYAQYILDITAAAVEKHVPIAQPCKYAKRWWTEDLTKLRKDYTYWRNQARAARRNGHRDDGLDEKANTFKKRFHDAARKQRSNCWQDFVQDAENTWDIAKYAKPDAMRQSSRIPTLQMMTGKAETAPEIAQCLLSSFFPPLPEVSRETVQTERAEPLPHAPLTKDEVKAAVFSSHPYKAPGIDDLPAVVWQKLWPEIGEHITKLFELSLELGKIPDSWRIARIVPLRKPGKPDYTIAKAYRPISLLSTLGKAMEGVIAERLSYVAETHGLLPKNHFGARKNRSTVQALTLLQESIYNAWRERKVLSMVSFDVKGAYNGVNIGVLEHRLRRRRIPEQLIRWIIDFCSNRKASVMVNGHVTEIADIPQAGLPQGSKVSPMLFVFFNADLVTSRLNRNEGAMAFVDDYTAWVSGSSDVDNARRLQETIIPKAEEWERTSGATFEADKTSLIHFTRREYDMHSTLTMKGEVILPQKEVKVLGVVLDRKLRFNAHIARTAKEGIAAALALKRLHGTGPKTARRLFTALLAPAMDYASPVWSARATRKGLAALNVAQRIGAQAIVGAFRTVSLARAEAEASVVPLEERWQKHRNLFWIKANTLPGENPLARVVSRTRLGTKRYLSPLMEIARNMAEIHTTQLPAIDPFCIAPWQATPEVSLHARDVDIAWAPQEKTLYVYAAASYRKDNIGVGLYHEVTPKSGQAYQCRRSLEVGSKAQALPAEIGLHAINAAVDFVYSSFPPQLVAALGPRVQAMQYTIVSTNKAAVQAIKNMRRARPYQAILRNIAEKSNALRARSGPRIKIQWAPKEDLTFNAPKQATQLAKNATAKDLRPTNEISPMAARRRAYQWIKKSTRKLNNHLDTALPGKHTKEMYDQLTRKQSAAFCQLRTDMSRLNSYLFKIKASDTALCDCGNDEIETTKHFLFECPRWEVYSCFEPTTRDEVSHKSHSGAMVAEMPIGISATMARYTSIEVPRGS